MTGEPTRNDLYREAQILIRSGQPVFPCKADGPKAKAPLTKNGWKDATLDLDQIKSWFKRFGAFGLGIPTGVKYDVLDVDVKESADGRRWLPELHRLGLLNGCKRVVKTPSGGFHLYFPPNPTMTNKARGATLGLDVRGTGGYVLAPPSYLTDAVNAEGRTYFGPYVDLGPTRGSDDTPLLWDMIVNALAPRDENTAEAISLLEPERQTSVASLREFVSKLMPGERNNGLFWAICRCIDGGIDPHELVDVALLIGLSEDEVMLSINSALKRVGVNSESLVSEVEAMFPDL